MDYSKIHKRFSKILKSPAALTNPGKYLGPNWEDVLNFWIYVDSLSEQEIKEMDNLYWALESKVRLSAWFAARVAAKEVVGRKFRNEAWRAARDVTGWRVFCYATWELVGNLDNKVFYDLIMSHKKS